MSLPAFAVRRPIAVAMLVLGVVLVGAISVRRLPIDLLPDVAYPQLVVYTADPGAAPAEVARLVTEPVEQAVSTVPGAQRVESVSREGVSLVTVRFAWGTDMDFAALGVREKLDNQGDVLPESALRPAVLRSDPRSEPILSVSVAGEGDLPALQDLAEQVFRRRLEQIDGVAQAAVTGGSQREIAVEADPERLEALGLTLEDVGAALDAANVAAPGGTVRQGRYRYALRTLGEFRSVDEIAEVPIRRNRAAGGPRAGAADGAPPPRGEILLRDVARVSDGFRERTSVARFNGEPSVGLLVFKKAGSNTVRVAGEVDRVLAQLGREYPTARVRVAASQAGFISDAISNVAQSLVLGGILAFAVLFLFLRDTRYPVAIALAIPISVVGTFALLDASGVSLNLMSLGGLALGVGMLVDNSIVVLESIFRHRDRGAPPAVAAALGAEEVQGAITASTLTTLSVFGPIVYVEGAAGQLFAPLSLAVTFSLLVSLLVALTLLPAMAARWEAAPADAGAPRAFAPPLAAFDRAFARFADGYHRTLEHALDARAPVAAGAALLLLATLGVGFFLPRGVLPEVDQGTFRVRFDLPPGTPLEETTASAARLDRLLRADPDVDAVFLRAGEQPAVAGVEDRSGLNTAALEVQLRPGASTAEVLRRIRPHLAAFPAGVVAVEAGSATAIGKLLGGAAADLAVRVRGADPDATLAYARRLQDRLAALPALADVRLGTELGQPEVRVEIDRERAASYGIDPRRVAEAVEHSMRGAVATEFVDFDRKVPVVVRLPERERRDVRTLETLRVDGIPLRELVTPRVGTGPTEIRRLQQSPVVPVYADVAAGGLPAALREVQTALRRLPPPAGIRVDVGGENEEMRRSFRDLGFAFGVALLLVYMILAAQFESLVHPFTILLSVPLALIGAVAALVLTGGGLNTMSLIGIVILIGIAVNDAIVKVDTINQLRREGLPLRPAILEAGRIRLRPILMTTATTVLGLLPMALGLGSGADLRAPLAVAVIGGLIVATLLTLLVIPVAYDLVEQARRRVGGWTRRGDPVALDAPEAQAAVPGD